MGLKDLFKSNKTTSKKTASKTKPAKRKPTSRSSKPKTASNKKAPATTKSKGKRKSDEGVKKSLVQRLTSILRKRIKAKTKMRPKNEYRYNHQTGHMTHVFLENENEYRAVGFTTKDKTFGKANMPLQNNPKKGDNRPSYVRNGIIADSKKSFSKKVAKNYKVSAEDNANIKSKERNYKKRQKK